MLRAGQRENKIIINEIILLSWNIIFNPCLQEMKELPTYNSLITTKLPALLPET